MQGYEAVTVIPAAGRDAYGDPLPASRSIEIKGCHVLPRRVNSPERGMVLIDGYEIFAPPVAAALAVTPRDTIKVRGVAYQVEGQPGEYRKRGQSRVVQIFVKRVGT